MKITNGFPREHVNLTISDALYWAFSFDEMGKFDIPAALDFILNVTKAERISYIGHSMGTVMFWVAMNQVKIQNTVNETQEQLCRFWNRLIYRTNLIKGDTGGTTPCPCQTNWDIVTQILLLFLFVCSMHPFRFKYLEASRIST